jgi:hypothetical protein
MGGPAIREALSPEHIGAIVTLCLLLAGGLWLWGQYMKR